ncbi:SMC1 [Symbiodinium sp. CCMP2592]|nr:SMC1 [Symbiodinium sp. CCMP2592]
MWRLQHSARERSFMQYSSIAVFMFSNSVLPHVTIDAVEDLTAFFEQISGSDSYRQDYDNLAAEKAKLEEQARYLFTKKRNAINERKRISQQKEEADEYRHLETQRNDLQREYLLFRLHSLCAQLDSAAETRDAAVKEREELREQVETGKRELEGGDRRRAQARLAVQQVQKELSGLKVKVERLNPERVANQSRQKFLEQRLEEMTHSAEQDGRRQSKLQDQLESLRVEEAKLEARQESLNKGLAERKVAFTADQLEEFERVKRATEKITAASGDELRQIEHQVRAVRAERIQAEGDQRDALARKGHLKQRVMELNEAETSAQAALDRGMVLKDDRLRELTQLRSSISNRGDEKDQLQQERQQLITVIQDFTATERQLEKDRELSQVCTSLAEACPGVCGRVVDLCKPSQKRLHVAVNVALARYLDAVIVDSSDTAKACVRYLKERMLPPMTFLPMTDLRVAGLDPRLQSLVHSQKGLRLALNCIAFDEKFARAFDFMLGDVVVADTMADGRRLAFEESRKLGVTCKVVTLAGEAIAKNGNLSVNSDATQEGATRFDLTEVEATRSRLEVIDRRLFEIHSLEASGGSDVAALEFDLRRVEGKAQEMAIRLQRCQDELKQKREELSAVEVSLNTVQPEAQRLAAEEARLREEQRRVEARVSEAVAGHFANLSRAMGVEDVRKLEREWRREQEAVSSQMSELERRQRNIKAEISMLQQTIEEQATKDPQELIAKFRKEVTELRAKEVGLQRDSERLESQVADCEERLAQGHAAERDCDKELSRLRQQGKDLRQQLMALEKKVSDLGSEQQGLISARSTILRQSHVDGIEVPLLRGGREALQELVEESQPVDAPTQHSPPGEAGPLVIDFALLPEEKRAASKGPAAQMLEDEYRSELERLRLELERLSPNLKALGQLQGVAENVQAASHEADVARKGIEEIEGKFEAVRKARKEKFMECFQKVSAAIGPVYSRLTANHGADGGSAYLDLEDTEDPFNGGIKFTAMPPAKRFRDMHLLSGGEKTLAAMALLFAVQDFQRPPFMVLDEVDAALDANNVRALSRYVEQADCQTIVISLKDRFYVRADALVGVWKNKPQETSAILTLDLQKYQESMQ